MSYASYELMNILDFRVLHRWAPCMYIVMIDKLEQANFENLICTAICTEERIPNALLIATIYPTCLMYEKIPTRPSCKL